MPEVKSGQVWRHEKTGGDYLVLHPDTTLESTGERMVTYINRETAKCWVRYYAEFVDGRFTLVRGGNDD